MPHGNWHDGMGGGSWWWMALMMVVSWAGLIVLAVALIRRPHFAGLAPTAHPTAQTILAERFARGEIDADEYRSRLDALGGRGTG